MPNADIKKFLPQHYTEVLGKNIPALIKALNEGVQNTETLIQACIDQLFLSTASGKYLVNLGEEAGFSLPANSGLDVRAYKALVPIMVSDPKQVRISIQELVRVFYGSDRTKANITATSPGPYSIAVGDNLIIETESGTASISIVAGQVSNLSSVSAEELSAVINYTQELIVADTVLNKATNQTFLRLVAKTPGNGAFVRVIGGTLQNVLKFPTLVQTNFQTQTFSITKPFTYSDEMTITWNGVGTNPLIFQAQKGDYLTIRGLVDGANPYSQLNGSFEIVDVGYDYFVIRNDKFDVLSDSITIQPDTFVITSSAKAQLFDLPEYAFVTEDTSQTITVTVPAIPPLARRFLKGSAHLRGQPLDVVDFTRNFITVANISTENPPTEDNLFVLANKYQRWNFSKKKYKTSVSDNNPTTPSYSLVADEDYAYLPYTSTFPLSGTNLISGHIGSNIFKLTFPFEHGLQNGWGFTLSGGTGLGNATSALINKEQVVLSVLNDKEVLFRITDTSGNDISFSGASWGNPGQYPTLDRFSTPQPDNADFVLTFPSLLELTNSGLSQGTAFSIDDVGGVVTNLYLANYLRYKKFTVLDVVGNTVRFNAGLGAGPGGQAFSEIFGFRDSSFGGSLSYFFDKTTAHNQAILNGGMQAMFLNYTQPVNSEYKGAFIFDPQGSNGFVTVSKYVAKLTDDVLKGDNPTALIVDTLEAGGDPFPASGKLVLKYGSSGFEGPISYFSTLKNMSQNQILIDPSYKFKKTHRSGSTVHYIHANTTYTPTEDGSDYPAYLTGTVSARNTLFELVELLVASGIFIERDVLIPELVNDDTAVPIFL